MNLYLISQTVNTGCYTYDSAVVAAESEQEAKSLSPENGEPLPDDFDCDYTWANPTHVKAELIGTAVHDTKRGLVLASFNAG